MADFFTHFSCLLDVGTPANAARALDLYIAFAEEVEREEIGVVGFVMSIQPEHGGTQLWIRDDVTGDPEQVLTFVKRCAKAFSLAGRWGFEWANTCSRPRVNAFGGGAHVLDLADGSTVAWTDTNGWLALTLADGAEDGR
ncbi:hypothetical protein [Inquilinus sp. CAU 1745]|uniref:hypothetical protein n=1 Tax=Inquilinus sp. CAU 1745 TaxID=3140369 RepID=UPI00325AE1C2